MLKNIPKMIKNIYDFAYFKNDLLYKDLNLYYKKETDECSSKLEQLEKNYPKLLFTCNESGKYLIYLEKGSKLYLKT